MSWGGYFNPPECRFERSRRHRRGYLEVEINGGYALVSEFGAGLSVFDGGVGYPDLPEFIELAEAAWSAIEAEGFPARPADWDRPPACLR